MRIRINLYLTIFLFILMLAGGLASSYIGYFMGREALKVVTQPEINSEGFGKNKRPLGGKHKGLKIIKEQDLLIKIHNQMQTEI